MAVENHVIIAGPGRVGATLLMKTLTELGMDTGFPKGTPIHHTDGCRFEWPIRGARKKEPIPYIIKEPKLCTDIDEIVKLRNWELDHVYIMLRSPGPAAPAKDFIYKGKDRDTPWCKVKEKELYRITRWFARRQIQLIHLLSEMDVPTTLISYPKFAEDAAYTYQKLDWLVQDYYDVKFVDFKKILGDVVDPEEIRYARETAPPRDRTYMREFVR